jgi:protocatechuate 3,4-dioxygenase beta subunit
LINDSLRPGVGEITYLSGRVLGKNGQPIRNAFVEIWQCDAGGAYLHSGSSNKTKTDANFQGYGRYLTDSQGRYFFRTIKPVPYPGRTPHIHFGVSKNGQRVLTTQMLVKDHPMNKQDFLFKRITNQAARDSLLVGFSPIKGSKIGELEANFDVVLGRTVQELDDGTLGGGLAKPDRARS